MNTYTVTIESWEGARFLGRDSNGKPRWEFQGLGSTTYVVTGYTDARRRAKAARQAIADYYRFGVVTVSGPLPSHEVRASYHVNPRPSEQRDRFEIAETREQKREQVAAMFRQSLNRRPVAEVSR